MSNSTTSDPISQQHISLPEWLEHVEGFSKSKMTKEMVVGNISLGLVCEAGEAGDVLKKHLYHGDPLDLVKLKKELGDVAFYWTALAMILEIDILEVLELNIEKLRARHGGKFFNRELQRANKALEAK